MLLVKPLIISNRKILQKSINGTLAQIYKGEYANKIKPWPKIKSTLLITTRNILDITFW